MISYEPLRILMVRRKLKKMDIVHQCELSPTTAAKLWNDEYVALSVIDRLCTVLGCQPGDLMEHRTEPKTAWQLVNVKTGEFSNSDFELKEKSTEN
ncbi:Cro/C1-type HTH DNA-binding domain [Desulfitobacterium hafniense]|uniref:Cro/C1-type HTH DNA-binding domain n=1 Tax=Desulfitobacterium hafniense TaxID=49338 RepID=A0A098AXH6_DESHA|nr:helix-turn-helix transcriptional regulator [Desulfitobacterium hafniense]CDX01319.1 Cro/C1-type HTH DNA-binding domain [Desulfitobacterium hafniense]